MSKSILTEYEAYSAFSGTPATCKHHCIFGTGMRQLAEDDGLWIPLLDKEHNMSSNGTIYQIHGNPPAEKLSKMLGQVGWEENFLAITLSHMSEVYVTPEELRQRSREAFMARYGLSYL